MTLFALYAVLGGTVLLLSFFADRVKNDLWISEPLFALAVGVVVGPLGFGLFVPEEWGDPEGLLVELARLTLAISLMAVAFRLPDRWVKTNWKPLAVMLLVAMPAMWLVSSLCGLAVFQLPVLEALALGAIVTPTDPVVASTVVTGKLAEDTVDPDTRHLISAESGANDGLAFILLMLPVSLLHRSTGDALLHWGLVSVLAEVGGAIVAGCAIGWLVATALRTSIERREEHSTSLLAVTIALPLALLGVAQLVHADGILAVFAAALVFNALLKEEAQAKHERIQSTVTRFLDVPVFMLFGMLAPVHEWLSLGWSGVLFVVLVLALRRIPVVLLLRRFLGPVERRRDALYVGWFGPIAVAALVYAGWAELSEGRRQLWVISTLVIFASIVIHGITATPATRLYARWKG